MQQRDKLMLEEELKPRFCAIPNHFFPSIWSSGYVTGMPTHSLARTALTPVFSCFPAISVLLLPTSQALELY